MRRVAIFFGVFAALTVALTLYIGVQVSHVSLRSRYGLVATFADATGLTHGDPVRLAGVPVGAVTSVKVVNGQAEVHFAVDRGVAVPDDSAVAVRWLNLIGQRELYLYPGRSAAAAKGGDRLTHTQSVPDLGQLVNQLGPLTQALNPAQINGVVQALVTGLGGNLGNVDQIVSDLSGVLGTLAQRQGTISQLITDYRTLTDAVSQRDLQIQTTVDNLVALAGAFSQSDQTLDNALTTLPDFTSRLNAVLQANAGQLGNLVDGLAVITGVTHERVADLADTLHNLPAAVQTLFQVTSNGNFLAVNDVCLASVRPPCPYPITLVAVPGNGPLVSSSTFAATLLGVRL